MNVDVPTWMIEALDRETKRLGVTRQSIIKVGITERWSSNERASHDRRPVHTRPSTVALVGTRHDRRARTVSRGLVDTSVFIARESGRPLEDVSMPDEVAVSIVTIGELRAGVLAADDVRVRERRLTT